MELNKLFVKFQQSLNNSWAVKGCNYANKGRFYSPRYTYERNIDSDVGLWELQRFNLGEWISGGIRWIDVSLTWFEAFWALKFLLFDTLDAFILDINLKTK